MSGVVLANASLDIAFHDKSINNKIEKEKVINDKLPYENRYIEQFFVGLLEGDGTITCNLNSNKSNSIIIRIVISLNNKVENVNMLNVIKETIGGRVVIERKDRYVTWIASNKNDLAKVFAVLAKYPLLTARKQCQLEFAKNCLLEKDVKNFIENRNNKYKNKSEILQDLSRKVLPYYFPQWFSGFVEAEGNFSLVFNEKGQLRKSAFTIGQNDELHILEWIKLYSNSKNTILKDKPKTEKGGEFNYYRLHLYNAESRKFLFEHFYKYPLLGYKKVSYLKFFNYYKK